MPRRFPRRLIPLLLVGGLLFFLNHEKIDQFVRSWAAFFQEKYIRFATRLGENYEKYLQQAETIERVRNENLQLQKKLVRCRQRAVLAENALTSLLPPPEGNLTMVAVRPYSYAKLGNFQRFRLENFPGYDPTKNYGVVRQGYAVGIVVSDRSKPLMILAGDKFSMFAVYIGKIRAPGIATGLDERHMNVKYISEWMKIREGDEVFTSGLDHIFPAGIPVGRVVKIQRASGFKNALIELYGDTVHPDFVWVVRPSTTLMRRRCH